MGVNGTGQIFKGFTFDGENSKNYGVHITGAAVYNAPVRDVEMITIPGRNGAFALDHGKFDNIEVTYPAGMFGATQTDFADGISALRNFLCSRKGYCRLTDDYNANEYRMAVYKSGLEASPVQYGQAGEFDITFECKPQRFLTSGETATTVSNNGTLTNPTLFPSSPLLQVSGHGTVNLGSESINVTQNPYGEIAIADSWGGIFIGNGYSKTITLDTTHAVSGDAILFNMRYTRDMSFASGTDQVTDISATYTGSYGSASTAFGQTATNITVNFELIQLTYGTSKTVSESVSASITLASAGTVTSTVSSTITYNGSDSISISLSGNTPSPFTSARFTLNTDQVMLYSSQTAGSIFIDCEIGEAYTISNNVMTSANNIVVLPAELPTLQPGSTTITKDNTITQLKITPRWWKI